VALLSIIFTGLDFGTSHSSYGTSFNKKTLKITSNDTLKIKAVNDDNIYYLNRLKRNTYKQEVSVNGKKMTYSNYIKVNVKKSSSDKNYITIQKKSKGKSKNRARKNAKRIKYKYKIIDNTIVLDAYFLSGFKNLWKDEEINITIYLKENTTVYFDNSIKNFLYRVSNKQNITSKNMGKHHFIMTNKTLKCTDCIVNEKEVERKINTDFEISDMTKTI
jgi:hypothetical protein